MAGVSEARPPQSWEIRKGLCRKNRIRKREEVLHQHDNRKPGEWIEGGQIVGSLDSIEERVRSLGAKTLVVDDREMRSHLPVAALTWAKHQGMTIYDAGAAFEMICRRVCSRTFRPSQIIFANEMAQRPNSLALQSIYTNLVALVAYILTLPVLALAALAIRVSSSGPAFITEQYAGFNGIPFSASRLRCAAEDDPSRTTRVGAVIRALQTIGG